jgi:hypothetical protein
MQLYSCCAGELTASLSCCRVQALCYAAFGCFGIEYISLFLGISMFVPSVMGFNVLLHFAGAVLVGLLYTDVSHKACSRGVVQCT